MKNHLLQPLTLPCGATLTNRLAKAAMTERISDKNLYPTGKHQKLYRLWSETGAGLLITGNVMIDPIHMESAGNVYLGSEKILPQLSAWADHATHNGNHAWVQISHAGRQTNKFMNLHPKAPSPVAVKKLGLFGTPITMTEEDIHQVIKGFSRAASLSKQAGFTGVQIHSAHGYLLSQFLSPKTNIRKDNWGGNLDNRSRILHTIIKEVRAAVGPSFPISVKLNSSDFQKGGFTEEESLEVIKQLKGKIDLLEISGGTYENLVFLESQEKYKVKESTRKREAYFLEFAQKVRAISDLPLMITGGFRSFEFCNQVLKDGNLDVIGMARPFLTNVLEIQDFMNGKVEMLDKKVLKTGIRAFDSSAEGGFYAKQLIRLSEGHMDALKMSGMSSALFYLKHEFYTSLLHRMRRKNYR